jgi:hypothetical protein
MPSLKSYPSIFSDRLHRVPRPEIENANFVLAGDKKNKTGAIVKEYYTFESVEHIKEFLEQTPPEKRHFHEWRRTKVSKVFFDIDLKFSEVGLTEKPKDFLKNMKKMIIDVFNVFYTPRDSETEESLYPVEESDLYVYTSSSSEKESYHIIINKYYVTDVDFIKQLTRFMNSSINCYYKFPQNTEIVDPNVYRPANSGLRLLGNRKMGSDRVKIPVSSQTDAGDLSTSMITTILFESTEINIPPIVVTDEEISEEINSFEDDDFDFIITNNDIDRVRIALMNVDPWRADNFREWMNVCFSLKNSGYPFELFDEFSQRSEKYVYDLVLRAWDGIPVDTHTKGKRLTVRSIFNNLKKDAPKVFKGLLESHGVNPRTVFNRTVTVTPEAVRGVLEKATISEVNERYLSPESGFIDSQDLIIKSYLGTGKTQQITRPPEIVDTSKSVLIIVNRVKLAKEFFKRFFKYGFNLYTDIQTPADRINPVKGSPFERLIIQPESLWKVPLNQNYDLIILDEVESSTIQFSSTTMTTREHEKTSVTPTLETFEFSRYEETAYRFVRFLRTCAKIVMADAFLSMKSIDFYKSLKRQTKTTVILNGYTPEPRKAIRIPMGCEDVDAKQKRENLTPLFDNALKCLKDGKKIFFVFSSRSKLEDFEEYTRPHGFDGIAYSGKKNNMKNVGFDACKEWTGKDYVSITTAITTGIDFSELYFDYVFVYFQSTPLARDIFQSIMRVRHLKENTMYYSISLHSFPEKGAISIDHIKNEINVFYKNVPEKWAAVVKARKTNVMKTLVAYNIQEKRLNSRIYGYIVDYYMKMCKYETDILKEDYEEAETVFKNNPTFQFDEVYSIVKDITPEELKATRMRIQTPHENDTDCEVLAMNQFIKTMRLNPSTPGFEEDFEESYTYLRTIDEKARGYCMKLGKYINREKWEPLTGEGDIEKLDPSNPKIKKLAEYAIADKLSERLRLKNIAYPELITKDIIENLDSEQLRKWSIDIFKMEDCKYTKDPKTGKTKRVKNIPATSDNNNKFVSHIVKSFTGGSFSRSKQRQRKKVNGKMIDVTPYMYNPPPKMENIYNLSEIAHTGVEEELYTLGL